jgi:hypothetical protein
VTAGSSQRRDERESNRALLVALARDRTTVLTEKEYRELRDAVLRELARGPRLEWSLLTTFSVIGLLCLGLMVLGIVLFVRKVMPDVTLALASACALAIWAFVFRSYLRDVRERSGRALAERIAEIQQLREANLITLAEHDRIYAAIMMSREPTRKERNAGADADASTLGV